MRVLSDSSPLITLAKIGRFDLLQYLHRTVTITPEVYGEVALSGAELPGASEMVEADWIRFEPVQQAAGLTAAQQRMGIGIGEASVILLGHQLKADVLLMDDRKARRVAKEKSRSVRVRRYSSRCLLPEAPPGFICSLSGVGRFRRLCRPRGAGQHFKDTSLGAFVKALSVSASDMLEPARLES